MSTVVSHLVFLCEDLVAGRSLLRESCERIESANECLFWDNSANSASGKSQEGGIALEMAR